jgi:HEPN domain-containing protein
MAASDRAVAFLEMARRDLAATQAMADRHVFAVEVFGFHAQQAVEKALKAWIEHLGGSAPMSHNLVLLLSTLDDLGADVGSAWPLVHLSSFAVQYRYEAYDATDADLDRPTITAAVAEVVVRIAAELEA